jgi:hypothetical protein
MLKDKAACRVHLVEFPRQRGCCRFHLLNSLSVDMPASLSLTPHTRFPSKKENKSTNYLCRSYAAALRFGEDSAPLQGVVEWHFSGAGRDVFFFENKPLIIKGYPVRADWLANRNEDLSFSTLPQLHQFVPRVHGRVETQTENHIGNPVVLDCLIQEKAGYSLGFLLENSVLDESWDAQLVRQDIANWLLQARCGLRSCMSVCECVACVFCLRVCEFLCECVCVRV